MEALKPWIALAEIDRSTTFQAVIRETGLGHRFGESSMQFFASLSITKPVFINFTYLAI